MASNTSNIPVTELDFDQIKENLKNYLKGQDQFKDFDFEGAAMNILLDTLAYNTHYHSFYINMVANEMFLDSAITRSAVVSLAKQLGYTPRSIRSSRATVNVVSTTDPFPGDPDKFLSPDTIFQTTVEGITFNFVNLTPGQFVQDPDSGDWVVESLVINEGTETQLMW